RAGLSVALAAEYQLTPRLSVGGGVGYATYGVDFHEVGRAGLSVALAAEYQLTPRLSVGGGVGYATYGVDLRLTTTTTAVRVAYDSTTTTAVRVTYDSTTTTVRVDSTRFIHKTITPRISTQVTVASALLQPQYRFFTVPLRVRYRFSPGPGRWWADVSGGAQLQFFFGRYGRRHRRWRNFSHCPRRARQRPVPGAERGPVRRAGPELRPYRPPQLERSAEPALAGAFHLQA
ncbi:hypothetical protein, partial [Hymenobacter coccineus]|uniref:hypothetical protein n=1 Tax=Hymenobacter coccineus TaxID=1908235 RepID=UPI0013010AB8